MFSSINLNDLTDPQKTAAYFLAFPDNKQTVCHLSAESKEETRDRLICSNIAQFVYDQQIDGQFFLGSFHQKDFTDLLSISAPNVSDSSAAEWIWQILSRAIQFSLNPADSAEEMEWITSSWTRHQLLSTTKVTGQQKPAQNIDTKSAHSPHADDGHSLCSESDSKFGETIPDKSSSNQSNIDTILMGNMLMSRSRSTGERLSSSHSIHSSDRVSLPQLRLSPFQSETDLISNLEDGSAGCELTPRVQWSFVFVCNVWNDDLPKLVYHIELNKGSCPAPCCYLNVDVVMQEIDIFILCWDVATVILWWRCALRFVIRHLCVYVDVCWCMLVYYDDISSLVSRGEIVLISNHFYDVIVSLYCSIVSICYF